MARGSAESLGAESEARTKRILSLKHGAAKSMVAGITAAAGESPWIAPWPLPILLEARLEF